MRISPVWSTRARSPIAWLGLAAIALTGAGLVSGTAVTSEAPADSSEPPLPFTLMEEFYGNGGYRDPELANNQAAGMMNGIALAPVLDATVAGKLNGTAALMLRMAAANGFGGLSAIDINNQVAAFSDLAPSLPGTGLFWNLMPEWDQSGGQWVPQGRPSYSSVSRQDAYNHFLDYYNSTYPELIDHLRFPVQDERAYRLTAITDYSPNVFYAYELGAEMQMLERGIDELGDLSTGIAFLRGAARQFGRPWGIDISSWRTSTNGATKYDAAGHLRSGWSADYLKRLYYLSFAAGAQIIHNEAASYRNSDGTLNPLGEAMQDFADFSLRRHPDIGQPTVNTAFLVDHYAGFDPKHGVHNQQNSVWYQDIPYNDGDHMTDNLLRLAYPGHWLHGLAPGARFANRDGVPNPAAFASFLAQGGDARPYEPMPTTRWGDNIDVITTHATSEVFDQYKLIILVGQVSLDAGLRDQLTSWVQQGGVLVMNAAQAKRADEDLAGVRFVSQPPRNAATSRWLPNPNAQTEAAFTYAPVRPTAANVLAVSEQGDALITIHPVGGGQVVLSTPMFFQSSDHQSLLISNQLLDVLFADAEAVRIEGAPIEYVVGRTAGKIVVTLANHSASTWSGRITASLNQAPRQVSNYISDEALDFTVDQQRVIIPDVQVAPYGVAVIALEFVEAEAAAVPLAKSKAKGSR